MDWSPSLPVARPWRLVLPSPARALSAWAHRRLRTRSSSARTGAVTRDSTRPHRWRSACAGTSTARTSRRRASAWPKPYPGTHMTLSLRPNPRTSCSEANSTPSQGHHSFCSRESELTFWHENTTGNPLKYPHYVNNAHAAIRMQKYGQKLCHGTKVLFGVITVGPVVYQKGWIAPGLDWYGDDLYEFPKLRNANGTFSKKKVVARLNQNLTEWRKITGKRSPAIRICEANSPYDAHRAAFFATIAHWLAGHNGNRMLTYWNAREGLAKGGVSGAWPPSKAVISGWPRWPSDTRTGPPAELPGSQAWRGRAGQSVP